jgi:aminoglycoside 3-N-acetyltransferase I
METIIKKLNSGDIAKFTELINLFAEVFEMKNFSMPNDKHLLKVLTKPHFMVFVAIRENQVVGGLTAYTLEQYYSDKPLAYLYDLAIRVDFQCQGIGKKLIAALTEYCRLHGYEEVFVQADKVDDYALEFYRSTPITNEEQVVHFYYTLETNQT